MAWGGRLTILAMVFCWTRKEESHHVRIFDDLPIDTNCEKTVVIFSKVFLGHRVGKKKQLHKSKLVHL